MSEKLFKAGSLDECIKIACSELNISQDSLKYRIVEEKKSLFKKYVVISVEEIKDNNGKVSVNDGVIIVKDPEEGGKPAIISTGKGIYLTVNGIDVKDEIEVYAKDEIKYSFDEDESQRFIDVNISEDKLECKISVKYIPKKTYKLIDCSESKRLVLRRQVSGKVMPPKFTFEEVKEELARVGVVYGIQEEDIRNYLDSGKEEIIVAARGEPAVDDIPDVIKYKFDVEEKNKKYDDSNYDNIDYRDANEIVCVKKGDIIAERIPGSEGKDGKDIFGKVIKKKSYKSKPLRVGTGCKIVDDNIVVSELDGRPYVKSNIISVKEMYEVQGDVNIKTGNIKFIGDVKIHGAVTEGMTIESGGIVEIMRNVENSTVSAVGDIIIRGNILGSNISAGGDDVTTLKRIKDLESFATNMTSLMEAVSQVKKFNLLGYDKDDGEVIKYLLETKYRFMNKTCLSIIKDCMYDDIDADDRIITLIRQWLVGMAPLGIKNYGVLNDLVQAAKYKIEELNEKLALPVNVNISYCQDSTIKSSGDIVFTGKGEYISNITAYRKINFTVPNSVVRGGELYAGEEIKCKNVGSLGGVATKLSVGEKGHIWIAVAYQNTKLSVGGKEMILDSPSRNIHAYLDSKGDLVVDKLKL
ncbi:MAG: DUF342 domain-containing protein [Clostridiales bacterium]|uniref:DUF342 domain-containing protein n=1 Tax=Clostridium sp. N3C TaxID=1776758 RepID=UPI00092E055E|nr:flagellar assembly protein A [Clostridium sp. N3C]NLZ49062.1 DUF342 domain-containing protein [Clostridiales bacterium]SCN21269.1 hypothetical protein N3C_0045 [Clostridium sp. N3C]